MAHASEMHEVIRPECENSLTFGLEGEIGFPLAQFSPPKTSRLDSQLSYLRSSPEENRRSFVPLILATPSRHTAPSCSLCSARIRQAYPHDRSLSDLGIDFHLALMSVHNLLTYVKPQPVPKISLGAEERLKEELPISSIDATSSVLNDHLNLVMCLRCT